MGRRGMLVAVTICGFLCCGSPTNAGKYYESKKPIIPHYIIPSTTACKPNWHKKFADWALNPKSVDNTYSMAAIELSDGRKRVFYWTSTGYSDSFRAMDTHAKIVGTYDNGKRWQTIVDFSRGVKKQQKPQEIPSQ